MSSFLAFLPLLAPQGFSAPDPACVRLIHRISAVSESGDRFGDAIALSGDTLVIGAPGASRGAQGSGAAYVFVRTAGGWIQEAELLPNVPLSAVHYGESVALEDDVCVIGSLEGAYVYERTNGVWSAPTRLIQPDSVRGDFFGVAVAISDGRILIGANGEDDAGDKSGKAYVYTRSGGSWVEEAELVPEDHAFLWQFGARVDLCGERALIGAWGADGTFPGSGAAYTFVRTPNGTWVQEQKLVNGVLGVVALFGDAVDLDGDRAIIGNGFPFNDRSAYVFRFDGVQWVQEVRLTSSERDFGKTVAIDGEVLLVGAPQNNTLGYQTGRTFVYLLRSGSWEPSFELPSEEPAANAGTGLALEDGTLAVGLPLRTPPGGAPNSGAIELHALLPYALPAVTTRNAGTNPLVYSAESAAIGETLHLTVFSGARGHTHALVVGFDAPAAIPLPGGQTLLCTDASGSGELFRTALRPGPIARFDVALPNDPALAGLSICTQAVLVLGTTPFALTNAQDVTIGGCPGS